jgi:large subunit ribosomal protein L17
MSLGKKGDLASRRNAAKTLQNVEILNEDETTQTALILIR